MTIIEKRRYDKQVSRLKHNKPELAKYLLNFGLWKCLDLRDIPGEKWKSIPNSNYFKSSNLGRIKSMGRVVYQRNGHPISVKEKILKQQFDRNRYLYVHLSENGVHKNKKVHILVTKSFKKNPENKETINHENGIRWHNEKYNLSFATMKENSRHSFDKNGRISPMKGKVGNLKGKFGALHHTSVAVVCINNGKTYGSMKEAARELKLDNGSIGKVCKGNLKNHKGYKFKYKNSHEKENSKSHS